MIKKSNKLILQAFFLIALIVGAFYLAKLSVESEAIRSIIQSYGYIGIFFIAFVSGFNLVVPIPAVAFLPLFIESGLHFYTTIVFITIGMTFADLISFAIGRVGGEVAEKYSKSGSKIASVLVEAVSKHKYAPFVLLFLFASLAPIPNELLLIPFGFLRYRLKWIIPILLIGNFVFNFVYSAGVIGVFQAI